MRLKPNQMTVKEACDAWCDKYIDEEVTEQTIRNWARKYKLGYKQSKILSRSKWIIHRNRFMEFMERPEFYFRVYSEDKKKGKENGN